jgi:VWFA-related protein
LFLFAAAPAKRLAIPSLGETIEVSIANVDVIVTDRDGHRVHGLTQADFEIYEAGKLQPLSNFAEYRGSASAGAPGSIGTAASAESTDAAPPQRRTLAIFLERFRLQSFRVDPFIASIKQLVRKTIRPGDAVSLVWFDEGAKLRVKATDDVAAVERELDAIGRECTGPLDDKAAPVNAEMQNLIAFEQAGAAMAAAHGMPRSSTDPATMVTFAARSSALRARVEMNRRVAAINAVLHGLAGVEGKKTLLLATRRLGEFSGAEFYYMAGVANGILPPGERDALDNRDQIKGLIANANAAGVTVYPVYPSGLDERSADPSVPDVTPSVLMNETAMLEQIAQKTGGLTSYGTADIVKLLPAVADDATDYYSLAYRVTTHHEDSSRDIVVKTKNPSLRVRARREFVEKSDDSLMHDRIVAALYDEWRDSPMKLTATLGEPKGSGRNRRTAPLKVLIPIGALTLLPQHDKHAGAFTVYLISGGKLGEVSDVTRQTQTFEVPAADLQRAMASHFTYQFDLTVRDGTQSVAVGVLDEVSKTYGITSVRVMQ